MHPHEEHPVKAGVPCLQGAVAVVAVEHHTLGVARCALAVWPFSDLGVQTVPGEGPEATRAPSQGATHTTANNRPRGAKRPDAKRLQSAQSKVSVGVYRRPDALAAAVGEGPVHVRRSDPSPLQGGHTYDREQTAPRSEATRRASGCSRRMSRSMWGT
ncbi:hypothetical protein DB30_06175 [Enhygromyxa salina]|uniref:Uncharacterized protein n=1 Tax=Enhygromyxa salina TaxID=215803 RepID=A0A0C2CV40_9BACT|nr:hypothetical protein DB30_06175 [Enhygromyxa salina]